MPSAVTAWMRALTIGAAGAACVALAAEAQQAQPGGGATGAGIPPASSADASDGGGERGSSDAVIERSAPVTRIDDASEPVFHVRTGSPRETLETLLRLTLQMEFRLERYAVSKTPFNARRVSAVVTEFIEIIDLSDVGSASRRDVATETLGRLMDISGRIDLAPLEAAPGAEAFPNDASPASWRVPGTPLRIVRMTEGDRQGEFLFGPRTPELAEAFFERVRRLPLRTETELPVRSWSRTLPQWTGPLIPTGLALAMPEALRGFALDTPVWKILLTAALALVMGVVIWASHRLLAPPRGTRRPAAILRRGTAPALMMAAAAWAGPFLQFQISPSGAFAAITKVALVVLFFAGAVWLVWILIRATFEWIVRLRGLPRTASTPISGGWRGRCWLSWPAS